MENLNIHNLKSNLVNTIKDSGVPIGTVYYMLKDLLKETENVYKQILEVERQAEILSQEEKEREDVKEYQE